jgi:hypothetical protein
VTGLIDVEPILTGEAIEEVGVSALQASADFGDDLGEVAAADADVEQIATRAVSLGPKRPAR